MCNFIGKTETDLIGAVGPILQATIHLSYTQMYKRTISMWNHNNGQLHTE